MSDPTISALLKQGFGDRRSTDAADVIRDRILLRLGIDPGRELHPDAYANAETDFMPVDEAATLMSARGMPVNEQRDTNIGQALTTGHLGDTYALAAQDIIRYQQGNGGQFWRATTYDAPVRDFKPTGAGQLSVSTMQLAREHQEIEAFHASMTGDTLQVQPSTHIYSISRHAMLSEPSEAFLRPVGQLGELSNRLTDQRIVTALEDNSALADGVNVFDASRGNLLTSGGTDLTALEASYDAYCSMQDALGDTVSATPAVLVVPSSKFLTFSAVVTAFTAGNQTPPLQVVTSPLLSDSYFYLMGSPVANPVIARSRLSGGDISALTVEVMDQRYVSGFDGLLLRVRFDAGISIVSPYAVRNTTV